MKIPVSILIAVAATIALVPLGAAVTYDYTITYNINEAQQSVAYSVTGLFQSHPECLAWSVSAPATSTTIDPTSKQTYRVSLTSGVIEQSIQRDNTVTKSLLTCATGATLVLNPMNSPEYYHYDNDCSYTQYFVGSNSNPTGVAVPVAPEWTSFYDETGKALWAHSHICTVSKVGTLAATVPFTGRVESEYWGLLNGLSVRYGLACSPLMLAGVPIGSPIDDTCGAWKQQPQPSSNGMYVWEAEAQSLALSSGHGVGSFGGAWISSSTL